MIRNGSLVLLCWNEIINRHRKRVSPPPTRPFRYCDTTATVAQQLPKAHKLNNIYAPTILDMANTDNKKWKNSKLRGEELFCEIGGLKEIWWRARGLILLWLGLGRDHNGSKAAFDGVLNIITRCLCRVDEQINFSVYKQSTTLKG